MDPRVSLAGDDSQRCVIPAQPVLMKMGSGPPVSFPQKRESRSLVGFAVLHPPYLLSENGIEGTGMRVGSLYRMGRKCWDA